MKRFTKLIYLLAASIPIIFISSCSDWLNPGEATHVTWATLSTDYVLQAGKEYPYYFITDDTLLFCPENHTSIKDFKPIDGQRIILYYQFHGRTPEEKELSQADRVVKYIDIVQMNLVNTEEFLYTMEPDTLGNDRVELQHIWIAGGGLGTHRYLNLQITIQAMDPEKHSFKMIYDMNRESPLEDGYYCLELRHEAQNDPQYTNFTTLLSYPVIGPCTDQGVKGLKIKVRTINEDLKIYTIDY
ncbi:MAG TPA: NigD-like C-terminal domain-containing protein [Bacteroidales bacterium]|nr:NigD-like C-terminal domain-containing protein [Bacteroidales bacterium]HQB56343.1 NigD-like C-terminal domain-containing protein [Bacteroidales bacterium]